MHPSSSPVGSFCQHLVMRNDPKTIAAMTASYEQWRQLLLQKYLQQREAARRLRR